MLAVVVFPFVPVTTIQSTPSDTVSSTSFWNFIATLPGSAVPPPFPVCRRMDRTHLQEATARIVFNRKGFFAIILSAMYDTDMWHKF